MVSIEKECVIHKQEEKSFCLIRSAVKEYVMTGLSLKIPVPDCFLLINLKFSPLFCEVDQMTTVRYERILGTVLDFKCPKTQKPALV